MVLRLTCNQLIAVQIRTGAPYSIYTSPSELIACLRQNRHNLTTTPLQYGGHNRMSIDSQHRCKSKGTTTVLSRLCS